MAKSILISRKSEVKPLSSALEHWTRYNVENWAILDMFLYREFFKKSVDKKILIIGALKKYLSFFLKHKHE